MAKLSREARLRERRDDKQAKKQARRDAASGPSLVDLPLAAHDGTRPQAEGDAR